MEELEQTTLFTEQADDKDPPVQETAMENQTLSDTNTVYEEVIAEDTLVGSYPFETIIESITDQFANYIGTQDRTDYVDIFYSELKASFKNIDEEEEHPEEIIDVLNGFQDKFIDTMNELFQQRLTINIVELESEEYDQDEVERVIRLLYNFFILNARKNFKTVISKDITSKLRTVIRSDVKFYDTIRTMLMSYSPLIIAMGPLEFLRYAGNEEVYKLFTEGKVVGNFLRKYSPRLYQYDDFEVEIVSQITMLHDLKEDLTHGSEE